MQRALIYSIVGARPNFMKAAPVQRALLKCPEIRHEIIHTGQHYGTEMSDTFFRDLKIPQPAAFLQVGSGSHAHQTSRIMIAFEQLCSEARPDLVLVYGDVNSTVACALTAAKMTIQVAHIEAGLRSFDRSMPEEINRIVTDSIADWGFVTETAAIENLQREGWSGDRMFLVGNTMIDTLLEALPLIERRPFPKQADLIDQRYTLVTLHRPSNVDDAKTLAFLIEVLNELAENRRVVFPVHPRTRAQLRKRQFRFHHHLYVIDPLGYLDFLNLMRHADFVLTDSGGVQEETTALHVPCLTIRTSTERPVTCEVGTNRLVVPEKESLRQAIDDLLAGKKIMGSLPPLWDGNAASRIADILTRRCLGHA